MRYSDGIEQLQGIPRLRGSGGRFALNITSRTPLMIRNKHVKNIGSNGIEKLANTFNILTKASFYKDNA